MYGAVPLASIKAALLALKAEGRLDRAKMVDLTNCTFDGHIYNTRRVMEECLAIKPDLIFLWDEAWFGFARWSPFLRPRTAMGAAEAIETWMKDPASVEAWEAQQKELGKNPSAAKLMETRLIPDPRKIRLRVYQTNSTHKSMSAFRQGSMLLVKDVDFGSVEAQFHEAVFTHASTSPNQQLIASLDVARRQMELEGYGLVANAIEIALDIRKEVNAHPVISKYFRVLGADEMIPAEYRADRLHRLPDAGNGLGGPGPLDARGRVLPRPDADDAGLRHRGLRRHPVQEADGRRVRHPVQQDLAQLGPAAVEHQQHPQRRGEPDPGAPGDLQQDRGRPRSDRRERPRGLRRAGQVADGGRARPAELQPLQRGLSAGTPARRRPRATCARPSTAAYYADGCEYLPLDSPDVDKRLKSGPEMISANFVIPYPPGFPIMVPGQVITKETIDFMRKLDVKEIHGFERAKGLKLIRPDHAKNHVRK